MYQKSNQFLNSLFSCESKLIGILCQNFCYVMRMVPILAHTGVNHQYQMSVFAHFLKEWLISKCQFCRKWTSNLLWKKNEENSDGNTVFPIKLQIFSFGFGSAEFRWSYFGFGFGSAETKKVISVAH